MSHHRASWVALICVVLGMACDRAWADGWTCPAKGNVGALPSIRYARLENILHESTTVDVKAKQLQGLLSTGNSAERTAATLALANFEKKYVSDEAAAAVFYALFDFSKASISAREEARENLAALLIAQNNARVVVELYEKIGRPICGKLSPKASYALALAYNGIGKDMRARQVFEVWDDEANTLFKDDAEQWDNWRLLRLRLDCAQQDWRQCGEDFDTLARDKNRLDDATDQLNVFLPTLKQVPEMTAIVDRLESDGVIDSNGIFLPMGSVVDPQPINCPDPQTLADGKHKSISGGIMVDFGIDAMGSVSDIQVITADPPGAFEATVFNTLQHCQFKPQLINGRPTPTSARRVYQFNQAPDQPSKAQ